MRQGAKRAASAALAAVLALGLTGCKWEDYFAASSAASSDVGGGVSGSSHGDGGIIFWPDLTPPKDDDKKEDEPITFNGGSYTKNSDGSGVTLTGVAAGATAVTIAAEVNGYKVTGIAATAFSGATSLKSVTFPVSFCEDMDAALKSSPQALAITISGGGSDTVSEEAFNGNSKIATVSFEGITEIKERAFQSCSSLTKVDCGTVKSIGSDAFQLCSSLKSIDWGEVESIGSFAFGSCGFEQLKIPGQIKEIGSFAFMGCDQLNTLVLSDGVQTIKGHAFEACSQLSKVYLPASLQKTEKDGKEVKAIDERAFAGCSLLDGGTVLYGGNDTDWDNLKNSSAEVAWEKNGTYDSWPNPQTSATEPELSGFALSLTSLLGLPAL